MLATMVFGLRPKPSEKNEEEEPPMETQEEQPSAAEKEIEEKKEIDVQVAEAKVDQEMTEQVTSIPLVNVSHSEHKAAKDEADNPFEPEAEDHDEHDPEVIDLPEPPATLESTVSIPLTQPSSSSSSSSSRVAHSGRGLIRAQPIPIRPPRGIPGAQNRRRHRLFAFPETYLSMGDVHRMACQAGVVSMTKRARIMTKLIVNLIVADATKTSCVLAESRRRKTITSSDVRLASKMKYGVEIYPSIRGLSAQGRQFSLPSNSHDTFS